MITLLIVDDEEAIRSGIKNSLNWNSYGIEVCADAENGEEALQIVKDISPDILLIDIKMPVMNGLEVIEKLSSLNSPTKSIILSGYDDFSYAQKALKYGASGYLLKPCRPQEILETVLKVKTQIEEERDKIETVKNLKIQFNKSLPFLKEKYLISLLQNGSRLKPNFKDDFRLYHILIDISCVTAAVIRIDDYSSFVEKHSNEDRELYKFAIKNITEEIFNTELKFEIFQNSNEIVIILNLEKSSPFLLLAEEVKVNIKKYLGFSVSIGVGRQYESIEELYLSYNEAIKSIDALFFIGIDTIVKYDDIKVLYDERNIYPINEELELLSCIKAGKSSELSTNIENFFKVLNVNNVSKNLLLESALALLSSLYHLCVEMNIETENIFGNIQSSFNTLLKAESFVQVKNKLLDYAVSTCEILNRKKSSNKIIETISKYIDKYYFRDLNLDTLAREVFITPKYLSLLFKQSTGINFVDYLNKVRVEKACEILKNFSLKTYEVASKVGCNDEKYFSQLFKKYTGMTPTQYRSTL